MIRRLVRLSLLFVLTIRGAALAPPAKGKDVILARVGSYAIRQGEFSDYMNASVPVGEREAFRKDPVRRRQLLEAYVDAVALEMKARKEGFDRDPRLRKALDLMEMKQLMQVFMSRHGAQVSDVPVPTEEELRAYYDQHPEAFKIQPHFTARQILVLMKGNPAFPERGLDDAAAHAKAGEALAKLRAGETWDKVAPAYSDDPNAAASGGLLRDAQFGYQPKEMEEAIARQELGKPGEPVKSAFGYHVLQVEDRILEGQRQSYPETREYILARILNDRRAVSAQAFLAPIREEMGLKVAPNAMREFNAGDAMDRKDDELLATLGDVSIMDSDFQWFFKDAFRPEQRTQVRNRPGARRELVASFLNIRMLAAKARKEGLDRDRDYLQARRFMEMNLLAEFLQERDGKNLWQIKGASEEEKVKVQAEYRKRLRDEMRARILSDPAKPLR